MRRGKKPVEAKVNYTKKDMADWARSAGLAIKMRPTVFPVKQRQGHGAAASGSARTWFRSRAPRCSRPTGAADKDISRDEVLTAICNGLGIDPQKFLAGIGEQAIKDQLKANTDEVMARAAAFGSPTIFVDKTDMYFGNDRLPLVPRSLAAAKSERRLMLRAVVCRDPRAARAVASSKRFAARAARAGPGARRRSCRRDQLSRYSDGGPASISSSPSCRSRPGVEAAG